MDPHFIRTVLLLLVAVVGATVGDTFLSVGMRRIGDISSYASSFEYYVRAFTSPWVIGGIGCLAVYFFLWLVVLAEVDMSLALPMTALTFVLGAFLARFCLGETVNATRWAGTAVIVLGVCIVAASGTARVKTFETPPASAETPHVSNASAVSPQP